MALTADKLIKTRSLGRAGTLKLAANAKPYMGSLLVVSATGYGKTATNTAGERVIGWCTASGLDNTGGADGAISTPYQTGLLKLKNDGTNPLTQADVGRLCFVKDDQTVQGGGAGSGMTVAGRVEQIDADGDIWVLVDGDVGGISGKEVDTVADNNTTPGVEVFHLFQIADAADADYDLVIKEKFQVLDVVVRKVGAGAGNTATVKNAANAISDAIAAAVDKTITRAGTIDPAFDTINAGGTLRVSVHRAAGSGQMQVTVIGRKVA